MNPARLVARVAHRYAVRAAQSTPDEINAHIDFVSQGLELHPLTWKAIKDFRRAIISHDAKRSDRDAILKDLDFDAQKRSAKRDARSKSIVKKIEKMKTFLTSGSVNAVLT